MIDTLLDWAGKILNFGEHWPDLTSIIIGWLCAWAVALIVEYFVPNDTPLRRQKGITVLVTVMVAAIAGVLVWGVMDKTDPLGMRVIICGVLAPVAPFAYMLIAAVATKYFPAIGSVWGAKT